MAFNHHVVAPQATHPTLPFGEWRRRLFQLPQAKGEKTLAMAAGVFLLAAIVAIFGVQLFGVCPVLGHSMEPTLSYWGGYYTLDLPTAPPKPGDLVALGSRSALGRSIKRVKAITPQGVVVVGDNANRSMDSEYGLRTDGQVVAIPLSDVRRVRDIWSIQRLLRSRTETGRIENWKQFSFSPASVIEGVEGVFVVKQEVMAQMYEGRNIISTLKLAQSDTITQQDGLFLVYRYEAGMPTRYTWIRSGLADRQLVGNVSLPAVPTDTGITLSSEKGDLVINAKSPFTTVEVEITNNLIRVFVVKGDHVIEAKRRDSGLKLAQIPPSTEARVIGVRPADWGEIPESGLTGVRVY